MKDFEKLGLPEDDLARLWLAFSKLRRHGDDYYRPTLNGDIVVSTDNGRASH